MREQLGHRPANHPSWITCKRSITRDQALNWRSLRYVVGTPSRPSPSPTFNFKRALRGKTRRRLTRDRAARLPTILSGRGSQQVIEVTRAPIGNGPPLTGWTGRQWLPSVADCKCEHQQSKATKSQQLTTNRSPRKCGEFSPVSKTLCYLSSRLNILE